MACLVLALLAMAPAAVASDLSETAEDLLGKYVRWVIETSLPLEEDPLLVGMVETIGRDIEAAGGRESIEHSYKILDVEDVNALAAPGGHIWITKGALRFVESPDELAGILGHETGHVSERHGWEAFKEDLAYTALLLGTPLGADYGLLQWVDGAYYIAGLKMSRDDEYEADHLGARYALSAGYDVRRMPDFFQRMLAEQGDGLDRIEVFFSTHPAEEDRIERIRQGEGFMGDTDTWLALGDGYLSRNLFDSALDCYLRAFELDDSAETACRAAVAAAFAGRSDRAAELLAHAEGRLGGASIGAAAALRDATEIVTALNGAAVGPGFAPADPDERTAALAAIAEAVAALDAAESDLTPRTETLDARRTELADSLRAAARIADGYARMHRAPSTVGASIGGDALAGAGGALRGYRQTAVAADARTDEALTAIDDRRELLTELAEHIQSGRGGVRSVELAEDYAERTLRLVRAVEESIERTGEALDALERGAEEIAAEPQALLSGGDAAMPSMRTLPGAAALHAASQLDVEAEEALATASLESSLLALSMRGAVSPASAQVQGRAIARLLGIDAEDFDETAAISSDLGDRALTAAVTRQTGCSLEEAAGILASDMPLEDRLSAVGSDRDNLAIALRLVAKAIQPRPGSGE
jgi:Zn-dependent protease with chaperone function